LTYRSFFSGENLVAVASIVQKWARFDLKWAWSEIFRARFARNCIFSPPTFNIFLRLCLYVPDRHIHTSTYAYS